jgi:hypothetical protein
MLDVGGVLGPTEEDSTRFEDSDHAEERVLSPGSVSQSLILSTLSVDLLLPARMGRSSGDGSHDTRVGLAKAREDSIAPSLPYHDRLFAA